MPEGQDNGEANATANGNSGGTAGANQNTDTFTAEDLQKEADRRVTEARKKWKSELDATIADTTKDAEAKLAALTERATLAETRAVFAEEAQREGATDIKAAWAVAREYGLIKDGRPDWKALKDGHPSLFAPKRASAAAAQTTNTPDGGKPNIDALLRAAAGFTPPA